MTFADRVTRFNRSLELNVRLPEGIRVMNPFSESTEALRISELFYHKFYNDNRERRIILGINPGRFGAGITGIPFTDTMRLTGDCGISAEGFSSYETSSVFIYDLIEKYGGVNRFYNDYYINSVCPLGFVKTNNKGGEVNYNYYDDKELTSRVMEFILDSLTKQLAFGIKRDRGYCLGTGKNFKFLSRLNDELKLFEELIPLEHPRYIMQYRLKKKDEYIDRFTGLLKY